MVQEAERRARHPGLAALTASCFSDLAMEIQRGIPLGFCHQLVLDKCAFLDRSTPAGICPSCLAKPSTSSSLSCGHNFCRPCIDLFSLPGAQSGQVFSFSGCPLCGASNAAPVRAKPLTAGVRILRIGGSVADAAHLVRVLGRLHELSGCLGEQFDLVVGSGIGLFFVLMLFCKQASIRDCEALLDRLRTAKVSRKELYFGHGLKFRHEEFAGRTAKVLIYEPTSEELNWLWPNSKVDVNLALHGETEDALSEVVDTLLASLFYIELLELPAFYTDPPFWLTLRIRCRLTTGPNLTRLIRRIRAQQVQLYYYDHSAPRSDELCSEKTYYDVECGGEFERRLEIQVLSLGSLINLQVDGPIGGRRQNLSNCPYPLHSLLDSVGAEVTSRPGGGYKEKVSLMGQVLEKAERRGSSYRAD